MSRILRGGVKRRLSYWESVQKPLLYGKKFVYLFCLTTNTRITMAKIAFKSDNQKQSLLLPPSLDELIPLTHSVRVVNAMIDRLDVDAILRTTSIRRAALRSNSLRTSTTCGFRAVRSPTSGQSTIFGENV